MISSPARDRLGGGDDQVPLPRRLGRGGGAVDGHLRDVEPDGVEGQGGEVGGRGGGDGGDAVHPLLDRVPGEVEVVVGDVVARVPDVGEVGVADARAAGGRRGGLVRSARRGIVGRVPASSSPSSDRAAAGKAPSSPAGSGPPATTRPITRARTTATQAPIAATRSPDGASWEPSGGPPPAASSGSATGSATGGGGVLTEAERAGHQSRSLVHPSGAPMTESPLRGAGPTVLLDLASLGHAPQRMAQRRSATSARDALDPRPSTALPSGPARTDPDGRNPSRMPGPGHRAPARRSFGRWEWSQ